MYLYAAECVEQQRTPFFDEIRNIQPDLILTQMKH
jgi:hypothetical protein